ncbi:hypothetical protein D1815_00555 [Aquimarina sp. AD1]|uniref:hypothetical protein n=2 Tax=Aquimarina sp. (strain AD1) TaxID=1714848 RepID=UPI000E4F6021|nr:hypothetical protein [Aquimarina sp. AD1]AXT54302.1 hypothetical protein D1815_00555 [Aquimarina sp. AD1]
MYRSEALALFIACFVLVSGIILPFLLMHIFELNEWYETLSGLMKRVYKYGFAMFYLSIMMAILSTIFFKKLIIDLNQQRIFIKTNSQNIFIDTPLKDLEYISIVEYTKTETDGVFYIKFKQKTSRSLFLKTLKKNFHKNKNIYYQEFLAFKKHLEYYLQNSGYQTIKEKKKNKIIKKYVLNDSQEL